MVRKTFVEWCREFRTPTKYEFWSMANTGLHISDVSPRGTASERIRDVTAFNIQFKEIKYALERWDADMQRKISESMILNSPTRM